MRIGSHGGGPWPALMIGLLWLSPAPASLAQSPSSPAPSASPGEPPAPQTGPTADSYVVSLSTGELIQAAGDEAADAGGAQPPLALAEYADGLHWKAANGDFVKQLFYGLSLAAAYSNDYGGLGSSGQYFSTISPYLGLLLPTRTGSLVLQYDAVINPHDANVQGNGAQAYHEFSLTAQGAMTRRWSWKLSGSGGYGSEALRMEGPLTFSVVESVPVLNAGSTVPLPAANVLFAAETAQLVFQKNERNSFSIALSHTYAGIEGDANSPGLPGDHSNTASVRADYTRLASTRLSVSAYVDQQTLFGSPLCYGYGGGLGLSARLSHAVSLDVQGGPEFISSGCGGVKSGDFVAAVTDRINPKDRVYATVSRMFTAAYQVNGTWQDTAAAGFSKTLGNATFAADAGFVRETLIGAPAYHGYFVAPRFHFKFSQSLGLTAGYRALWVTGGGLPGGNLNFVSVSLDWYPGGLRLR